MYWTFTLPRTPEGVPVDGNEIAKNLYQDLSTKRSEETRYKYNLLGSYWDQGMPALFLAEAARYWDKHGDRVKKGQAITTAEEIIRAEVEAMKSDVARRFTLAEWAGYSVDACSILSKLTGDAKYREWERFYADYIVSLQVTDEKNIMYGGFRVTPSENCRPYEGGVPVALKKAYDDFKDEKYRSAAQLWFDKWAHFSDKTGFWGYLTPRGEADFSTEGKYVYGLDMSTWAVALIVQGYIAWDRLDEARKIMQYYYFSPKSKPYASEMYASPGWGGGLPQASVRQIWSWVYTDQAHWLNMILTMQERTGGMLSVGEPENFQIFKNKEPGTYKFVNTHVVNWQTEGSREIEEGYRK
jgi:hypothetical protein